MGANDRALDKRDEKRERAKEARQRRAASNAKANWLEVEWDGVVLLVQAMAAEGGAVRLGLTRDGGAYALGMYLHDDYATEYIRPSEDFGDALGEIARAWLPDGGEAWFDALIKARTSREPR